MKRTLLTVATLLLVGVAGCLDEDDPRPNQVDTDPTSENERILGARPLAANGTLDEGRSPDLLDWYLVSGDISPNGSTSGFSLPIPADAILSDGGFRYVIFQVLPLMPEMDAVDEWGFYVFDEDGGEARFRFASIGSPLEYTLNGLVGGATEEVDTSQTPHWFAIGLDDDTGAGDLLHIVMAARGEPRAANFGEAAFMVQFIEAFPDFEIDGNDQEAFTEAFEAFLERLTESLGRQPIAPERTGSGDGFHQAYYIEYNQALGGYRIRTPTVDLRDPLVGVGAAVEAGTKGSASNFAKDGWTAAFAGFDNDLQADLWSVRADIQGQDFGGTGAHTEVVIRTPVGQTGIFGTSGPALFAVADGSGGSTIDVSRTGAGVQTLDLRYHIQVDLAGSLEELLGLPAQTGGALTNSLLFPVPQEAHAGLHIGPAGVDVGPLPRFSDL
ncbi:MAG: hypothetical protein ACPGQL_05605 [Thermoplasmatota archaeon]